MNRPSAYFGGTALQHADYNFESYGYIPPPAPKLNGGLYTGKPFDPNCPWGNVPVTADTAYMTHVNLRSANPPKEALYQYAGHTRMGNNYLQTPGVNRYSESNSILCVTVSEDDAPKPSNYMPCCMNDNNNKN